MLICSIPANIKLFKYKCIYTYTKEKAETAAADTAFLSYVFSAALALVDAAFLLFASTLQTRAEKSSHHEL